MDVMIFGATCAPSISQYVKNVNVKNVNAIVSNHYVDDLLVSVDNSKVGHSTCKGHILHSHQGGLQYQKLDFQRSSSYGFNYSFSTKNWKMS